MKFPRFGATLVAQLVLSGLVASSVAQENGAPPAGRQPSPALQYGVRVLDVKKVFDEYWYFKDNIKGLRERVKAFEETQRTAQKTIIDKEKGLPELTPGSEERRNLEKQVYQMKADLAAEANLKQKEFMELEAKVYFHTFNAIEQEVKYYCQVKNVAVVISYNSEKADPNNRQSIMRSMTNTIVACDPAVDITGTILRVLNKDKQPAADATPPKVSRQPGAGGVR